MIMWRPNMHISSCLNVDVIVNLSTGLGLIGGVLRTSIGVWLNGFHKFLGISSPLMAKLWGIYFGLTTTCNYGIESLQIHWYAKFLCVPREENMVVDGMTKLDQPRDYLIRAFSTASTSILEFVERDTRGFFGMVRCQSLFGLRDGSNLEKNLSVPLLLSRITSTSDEYLIQMVQRKLNNWKARTLSLARRIALAKDVLLAIPMYTTQTMKMFLFNYVSGVAQDFGKAYALFGVMSVAIVVGPLRDVNFWLDEWVPDTGPLAVYLTPFHAINLSRTCMADMAIPDGNWRWDLFQHLLPWDVLLHIAALKGSKASLKEPIWKQIHHYRSIQRIRIFMWLAYQRKFMTTDERVRRHFTSDSRCPICAIVTENFDHVLRFCAPTLATWTVLVKEGKLSDFLNMEFRDCIGKNITIVSDFAKKSAKLDLLFEDVIWNLWRSRNVMVFKNEDAHNGSLLERSNHLLAIMQQALNYDDRNRSSGIISKPCSNRWNPSCAEWIKLNTNDPLNPEDGRTSCGGMPLVWDLGFRRIVVDSDSLNDIHLVNGSTVQPGGPTLLSFVHELSKKQWDVNFFHVRRDVMQ
ncbi:hypothetical protein F3Y22_tig00005974pilonHSYRG00327 [Hibiscus syriacus]|uniref:Reverse transcriptase zinc-binding domain-containing protein n=1 Tax=Hibiscus syriacus TaxID=106335 RepID=A0A6A3CDM7_HIBSY|nr:hypothetical protein F3Y22_tig00005974pilonHSYRG00327 [Hibiscus syriacus]